MTDARRQSPAGAAMRRSWGQTHLALDAIVAFVDEELSPGARRRALSHLAGCAECASEVVAQTQARLALRASAVPSLPSSLLHSLRSIPSRTEVPAAPAGLAVGPDGELVSVLLGAGALVSGLAALGALVVAGAPVAEPMLDPGPRPNPPGLTVDAQLRVDPSVSQITDAPSPSAPVPAVPRTVTVPAILLAR